MKRLERDVHFDNFLAAVRGDRRPAYLPFYEHLASAGFIARRTGLPFDRMTPADDAYWPAYVDFWLGMGYDCVPMEVRPPFATGKRRDLQGASSHESESMAMIRNREDFEQYDWPDPERPLDVSHFERVGELLPEGVRIVGGVSAGPYEWSSWLMGTIGMSYLLVDDPELVGMVFARIGEIHVGAAKLLSGFDCIGALRQGDDLGFKTSTFLPPEMLREHVFPVYRRMAEAAHAAGKPFILHSCGNLGEVYDDIIDCGVDAKHSFEDAIMPVTAFKARYGDRVTPLGGLDVDRICRSSEEDLRAYARSMIEECFADGRWTLGTGNSLTNYMPVENYIAVLEEGMAVAG